VEEGLSAIIGRDEAEALVHVEPLHLAGRHVVLAWVSGRGNPRQSFQSIRTAARRAFGGHNASELERLGAAD
jgi:hypothetical protein